MVARTTIISRRTVQKFRQSAISAAGSIKIKLLLLICFVCTLALLASCTLSFFRWSQQSVPPVDRNSRLALTSLPDEVYETEWDMIMVDAPRGYFAEAPGRMAAIYSATVMARNRKKSGVTHVFLHDVNRKVERAYANEFLCQKYRKHSVGRLWHFEIPSASNLTGSNDGAWFC